MPMLADTTHLRLHGALDGAAATVSRGELAVIARRQGVRATVDLSGVTFIDGARVGGLAFLFRRLSASGRQLLVTGASGQPLALLRNLGLAEILGLPAVCNRRWSTFFGQARAA